MNAIPLTFKLPSGFAILTFKVQSGTFSKHASLASTNAAVHASLPANRGLVLMIFSVERELHVWPFVTLWVVETSASYCTYCEQVKLAPEVRNVETGDNCNVWFRVTWCPCHSGLTSGSV